MFSGKVRRVFVVVVVFFVSFSGISAGEVVYVDDDALNGGNGQSWASAYEFLQDALAVAEPNDEIRVAQGVYKPDRSEVAREAEGHWYYPISLSPEGSGDRWASFVLPEGVTVKGGYAGKLLFLICPKGLLKKKNCRMFGRRNSSAVMV